MGNTATKTRGTGTGQELVPVPFILQKKTISRNNIVVGDDPAQVRFLEQQLGLLAQQPNLKAQQVDRVTDDMLVGQEGLLYRVFATHRIDLSPEMRNKTGFWSAEPIVKGSAAINMMVKFAAGLLNFPEKKLTRDAINIVGDQVTKKPVADVRAAIWQAAWLLTNEIRPFRHWPEPWEAPVRWLDDSMNVNQRLGKLYKRLVGYSLFITKGPDAARKFGVKPRELQQYKDLHLDLTKVYHTICLLSQWKQGAIRDPYVCALQISVVWQ